jgi:hypothetical protein
MTDAGPLRFDYVRDDGRRRIRITAKEPLRAEDFAAVMTRQAAEDTWAFGVLYDMRAIGGATTRPDARATAELAKRFIAEHGPRGRVAVVTRDARMVGIAQAYADDGAKSGMEVQVFWDLAEAENWLGEER